MATSYYADIQKLYVAYFNRPADLAGLNYWEVVVEAANGNTSAIAAAFAASDEYQAAYGNMSFPTVVSAIYQNLFSRTPETAGLNYWTEELKAGRVTIDEAVTQIAAGAQNADKVAYDNKVKAATAFTSALNTAAEVSAYSGDTVGNAAKAFIGGITTEASLAAALVPATLEASVAKVLATGVVGGPSVIAGGIDGGTFAGSLNLGITLTGDAVDRSLDAASGPITYNGGAGNDNFNIVTAAGLTVDTGFAMDVDMGAGDDRLNIAVEAASNVTVDGGTGTNTIAVSSSHGTSAGNTFEGFTGFQSYEVEGNTATTQGFIAAGGNMAGLTRMNVATVGGAATTFIDAAAAADVFVTGKNQTLGSNRNAGQAFGVITLSGTESTPTDSALTVTLDNTARVDGVMTIGGIVMSDVSATNVSGVTTLNVVSAGVRDTSNVVENIAAERVGTFNLTGSQNLSALVSAGANSSAGGLPTSSLTISGATLTGDLDLSVVGSLVTAVDKAGRALVKLTGTAGDSDRLTLNGADLDISGDTTVSAFETVRFVDASGEVVIANFSDVDVYDIESTSGALMLGGMHGLTGGRVNTDGTEVEGDDLRFIADDRDTGSVLALSFVDADITSAETANDFTVGGSEIFVQGFRKVSLDLSNRENVNEDSSFDLNLVDEHGNDDAGNPSAYSPADVYTRQLTVSGGGDQGAAGAPGGVDNVDLGTLSTVLSQIDLSGFVGTTSLILNVFTDAVVDRNTTITLNGYGSTITENDLGADGHITTFAFTSDAVADSEDVVITGFDAFNAGMDLTNLSVLDLSKLGVGGLADLTIVEVLGDTYITSNDGLNFEIILVGVTAADLSNENFKFAA